MSITLNLLNMTQADDTVEVYRATEPLDLDALPDVHDTFSSGVTEYVDNDTELNTRYWYVFKSIRGSTSVFSRVYEVWTPPSFTGPGPQNLIGGSYSDAGFFGEVSPSDLITYEDLATQLGLTNGVAQYSDEPWLKFFDRQNILFVMKKPARHTISWNHINAVNAVYGDRIITIGANDYRIRLLKGASSDPAPSGNGHNTPTTQGSEWNRLIYPIHSGIHTNSSNPVLPEMGTWAQYSDADLLVESSHGNGSYNWCQETNAGSTGQRLSRGLYGVSYFTFNSSSNSNAHYGWRACLELV